MIELGSKVRDRVTGFTGTATARVEYLNGCVQYCVKPRMSKKGEMPEGQYIDDKQLEVIEEDELSIKATETGGPAADAPRSCYKG